MGVSVFHPTNPAKLVVTMHTCHVITAFILFYHHFTLGASLYVVILCPILI